MVNDLLAFHVITHPTGEVAGAHPLQKEDYDGFTHRAGNRPRAQGRMNDIWTMVPAAEERIPTSSLKVRASHRPHLPPAGSGGR